MRLLTTAWLLSMVVLAPATAQDVELLEQQAFRAAVDRVAGSVVRIETIGGLTRIDKVLFGDGPTTGLVVDPEGYIISSAFNFVNRPTSILVRLSDNTVRPATLVATDHSRMLVLLKIEVDEPLPVPVIAPIDEMRIGQWAIAVGRSFESERPGVAVGILSATERIWGKAIQTDAAVSPNNYGGPLIDVQGRVLGVLVPLSPDATGSMAGIEWYDSGIGFAIPGQSIMEVLPRLKAGEDLHTGILGIALGGKNLAIAEPLIVACRPYSPAAEAGVMGGDRIAEIDGQPIRHAADAKAQLNRRYAGTTIEMVVLRDEKRLTFSMELAEKLPPYRHPFLGILPMREETDESGVTVRYVYDGSPAAAASIAPGDRLVSFDGKPIENAAALRDRIATFQIDDEVKIEIRHGDRTRTVTLKLASLPEDVPSTQLPLGRTKPQKVAAAEPLAIPTVLIALWDVLNPLDGINSLRDQFAPLGDQLRQTPGFRWLAGASPPENTKGRTGLFPIEIAGVEHDAWAYVPEAYDGTAAHGVVLWLHGPGGVDFSELLGRWKTHCDRDDLILVAPQSKGKGGWGPGDEGPVGRLLSKIRATHSIDPTRVVAVGQGRGGTMAFALAWNARNAVRAVVAIDGPFAGDPPELSPRSRLAVYMGRAENSRYAELITSAIAALREKEIPVTVRDLDSTDLDDGKLDEIVRWIDMLDRI